LKKRMGIPDLLDLVLGARAQRTCRDFMASWLAWPRPERCVESFAHVVEWLKESDVGIPSTKGADLPTGKLMNFIDLTNKQMNTNVRAIEKVHRTAWVTLEILEQPKYDEIRDALMTIAHTESSLPLTNSELSQHLRFACGAHSRAQTQLFR